LEHLLLVSIKPGTLALYITFLKENVLDNEVWDPCVSGHGFKYFAFVVQAILSLQCSSMEMEDDTHHVLNES
jgi:hypothetical protein